MANNYEKILELVNAGNQMGLSNTIKRDFGIPLDFTSVQETYEAAKDYAATNAKAYIGQVLSVGDTVYVISETLQADGSYLKPVGTIPSGDGKSVTVTAEGLVALFGFADAAGGTLPLKNAETGAIEWKTLEAIGAGDGNDNTTYKFELGEDGKSLVITTLFNGVAVEGDPQTITLDVYTKGEVDALLEGIEDSDTTYSVAEGEKALKLTGTEFSTVLGIKYEDKRISLTGIDGAEIAGFDASIFVEDAVLTDAAYDAATQELVFTWNIIESTSDDGTIIYKTDRVPVGDLVDTYTAGNGIDITDNAVSIKLADTQGNITLDVTNGLKASIDLGDYATKQEITDAGYAVAADVEEAYAKKATTLAGYGITDAYTTANTYSKSEVDELINNINEGNQESAGAVSTRLETYITSNDKAVAAINEEIGDAKTADADATGLYALIDAAQAKADQGVADAATAQSKANTNAESIATLQQSVSGHDTTLAELSSKVNTNTSDITALKAEDVSIKKTLGTHGTDITQLKTDVAAHETAVSTTLPNAIAEKLATATFNETIANYYKKTEVDNLLTAKADQETTYTKTEVNDLLANLDQSEIKADIKANTDAIAALAGEGNTSTVAKNAADIATLDATLKAAIENDGEGLDSIKELASWIETHGTEAADMAKAIEALETKVDTGDKTVSTYVADAIADIKPYELPAATVEALGGVKANDNFAVATDGTVTKVSTDILANGANELVLFGGDAGVTAEA